MRSPQRQRTAAQQRPSSARQIRRPGSPARFAAENRGSTRIADRERKWGSREAIDHEPRHVRPVGGSRTACAFTPLNALSQPPFPIFAPRAAAALGRRGSTRPPAPGPAGPQVMRGGYIADTFNSRGGGSPECGHNVDVSEAC
jgi:hypothetical protein